MQRMRPFRGGGAVTKNLDPPKMVPPGTNISKYMDPPELIFQEDIEIFGLPVKYLDPQLVDVAH